VAKVAKEHSNEEEAALALQGSMSLVERAMPITNRKP